MPLPYYIENNTTLWIKDDIAPFGTNIYTVQKVSGYSPNDLAVFDFIDNFNDQTIDPNKWFTDGIGVIEETAGGYAHVVSLLANKYPRFVSAIPLYIRNYMVEYDVQISGASSEACRMGYTSHYIDGSELANWFLYWDSSKYLRFWTRINGAWALRWSYTTPISIDTWYKMRIIETHAGVKVQLLNSSSTLLAESGFFRYDYKAQNSIYFGQRSFRDAGYWDNFKIRRYAEIEPTVVVTTETMVGNAELVATDGVILQTSGSETLVTQDAGESSTIYKVVVKNNTCEELRDYQIQIPASSLGTLTATTSLNINTVYKSPLKSNYYNILYNCTLNIPDMTRDITDQHTLTTYNTLKTVDRFNGSNNSTLFDGINSRGVLDNATDLNLFNSDTFTLHCWLRQIGNYPSTWVVLLSDATGATANRWYFRIVANEVGLYVQDADSNITLGGSYSPTTINDGQWHLVTIVRNGANLLIYKDGVYVRTFALTGITNFSSSNNINIGCSVTNGIYERFFNGEYGEITLHSTAFSDVQVSNYYTLSKYKYIENTSHLIKF